MLPPLLRAWATAFIGVLLLQAVWLLAVPPFQGVDEHDHVFKAAAVARGDWTGTHDQVKVGRGELLAVPPDIVDAAVPACEALGYTQRDDCNASAELADGRVLIGSSAARYHPVFYAVVGTVALPFDGAAAVVAMRIATGAWCAALLALAIVVVRRTARTRWPAVACCAGLTATMLYSTTIVAPNGPEMAAGLLLWCCLLYGSTDRSPAPPWVVAAGTVAAVHLAALRALGPLWLLLVLATAALAMGLPALLRRVREPRLRVPVVSTSVALVCGAAWTVIAGTNSPSAETGPDVEGSPWPGMFSNWLAWVFQQVSAVPTRTNVAPMFVYAVALALWTILLILALRAARGRERLAILGIFAVVTVMSITLTVLSYTRLGYAWQGRYAWPYVVGWLMLCGRVMDRSGPGARSSRVGLVLAAAASVVCLVGSAEQVVRKFATESPYVGAIWTAPPIVLICCLAVAGFALVHRSLVPGPVPPVPGVVTLPATTSGRTTREVEPGKTREAGRRAVIG